MGRRGEDGSCLAVCRSHRLLLGKDVWISGAQSVPGVAEFCGGQGNHPRDGFKLGSGEELGLQDQVFDGQIGLGEVSEGCDLGAAGDKESLTVSTEAQMHEVMQSRVFELRGNCFACGCIPNLDDALGGASRNAAAIGAESRLFHVSTITKGASQLSACLSVPNSGCAIETAGDNSLPIRTEVSVINEVIVP